jgi:hypothetical protein
MYDTIEITSASPSSDGTRVRNRLNAAIRQAAGQR